MTEVSLIKVKLDDNYSSEYLVVKNEIASHVNDEWQIRKSSPSAHFKKPQRRTVRRCIAQLKLI